VAIDASGSSSNDQLGEDEPYIEGTQTLVITDRIESTIEHMDLPMKLFFSSILQEYIKMRSMKIVQKQQQKEYLDKPLFQKSRESAADK